MFIRPSNPTPVWELNDTDHTDEPHNHITTILQTHQRTRTTAERAEPTPLSRPNPTADSEEAAPSEPAAPGTVTADDRK